MPVRLQILIILLPLAIPVPRGIPYPPPLPRDLIRGDTDDGSEQQWANGFDSACEHDVWVICY